MRQEEFNKEVLDILRELAASQVHNMGMSRVKDLMIKIGELDKDKKVN